MAEARAGLAGARPHPGLTARLRAPRRSVPFQGLMLFTFVLFVAPQNAIGALAPLMLAKTAVGLALIAYLGNRATTGRPLTVTTPTVRWSLLLAGVAILSIPTSFWPGGSVDTFTDLFGKSLVVFLLIANVVDTPRRTKLLIGSMIAWGTIAAFVGIANFAAGRVDTSGQRIAGYESPLAVNPNDLALTLNILLALGLGLLPTLKARVARLALLGALALCVGGVVVSFSRSGFITLGVVAAMWVARALRERGARALLPIALAGIALASAIPAGYSDRLSTITDADADTTGSSQERWETMTYAAKLIVRRPLLGVGLGNNQHFSVAEGGLSREAHNAYLKAGAELGIGGLVAYIGLILSSIGAARVARRRLRGRPDAVDVLRLAGGVELALVAFAVGALFSPVPYHFYFYYPAGLAVALSVMASRLTPRPAATEGA